jgi:hypothetical protein
MAALPSARAPVAQWIEQRFSKSVLAWVTARQRASLCACVVHARAGTRSARRGQGRDSEDVSVIRAVGCAGRGSSRKGLEGVQQFAAGGVSSLRTPHAIARLGPTPEHRLSLNARRFAEWRASSRGS